ncbi:MAG: UvrD-helicase domain-containing protein, partial [Acidobacteriota bacterium]
MSQDLPANDEGAREQAADPHFNVALEASAGTGKTRVLVDRYLRLLEEGTQPRHILAITFTRKASGEMKSRIIEELRKRGPLWKELRERLFDIHIATIDAFCLGLLREFPLEAGLDPDVELLDEVDASRLMAEAIDEVLAEAARPGGADLGFLFSCFGDAGLRRGLRDFLRSRLVKEELLHRFVAESIPRSLRLEESLRRAATGLRDILAGAQGLDAVRASGPPSSLLSWQAWTYAMARAVDPHHASAIDIEKAASYFLTQTGEPRKRLHPAFKKSDFPNPKQHEEHCDLVLARAPEVAEVYRRWMDDRDRYAVRELWKLYRRAARRFTELKKIRGHLDFTDVLLHAVRLLEQRGEFSQSRFRLEARYHHLLIDELQDTNQVQWRLVMALVGSWGEGAGLVQDAILAEQAAGHGGGRLREPTLFVVGDRKQSIYGWRDARVEVMESAARHILRLRPGGGSRLTIRRSFRVGGELLDFLNDVFSEVPQVREELGW